MENISNNYQKAIEILVKDGHTILQVFNVDGTCFYFDVFKFQESLADAVSNLNFNSVIGINITDFMTSQGGNPNAVALVARFHEYIDTVEVVRCEFCSDIRWIKWGNASR